jgi:hypothetical protein
MSPAFKNTLFSNNGDPLTSTNSISQPNSREVVTAGPCLLESLVNNPGLAAVVARFTLPHGFATGFGMSAISSSSSHTWSESPAAMAGVTRSVW